MENWIDLEFINKFGLSEASVSNIKQIEIIYIYIYIELGGIKLATDSLTGSTFSRSRCDVFCIYNMMPQ